MDPDLMYGKKGFVLISKIWKQLEITLTNIIINQVKDNTIAILLHL